MTDLRIPPMTARELENAIDIEYREVTRMLPTFFVKTLLAQEYGAGYPVPPVLHYAWNFVVDGKEYAQMGRASPRMLLQLLQMARGLLDQLMPQARRLLRDAVQVGVPVENEVRAFVVDNRIKIQDGVVKMEEVLREADRTVAIDFATKEPKGDWLVITDLQVDPLNCDITIKEDVPSNPLSEFLQDTLRAMEAERPKECECMFCKAGGGVTCFYKRGEVDQ